ncbi:hypothetical protein NPIL_34771, partial [Nephila pilipes]
RRRARPLFGEWRCGSESFSFQMEREDLLFRRLDGPRGRNGMASADCWFLMGLSYYPPHPSKHLKSVVWGGLALR